MQCKNNTELKEKDQEEKTQSILYWFTLPQGLRPVFSTPLAKKVPLTQLIVHIQLINQFLLPVEIKNPAKLINCSLQLSVNFSRNTRLTPIAQTNTIVQYFHRITMNTTQILIQIGSRRVEKTS